MDWSSRPGCDVYSSVNVGVGLPLTCLVSFFRLILDYSALFLTGLLLVRPGGQPAHS